MKIIVDESLDSKRIDVVVAAGSDGEVTRSTAGRLIDSERVKLNGEVISSKSYKVKEGDIIELNYSTPVLDEEIEVLFESDDELVINKPAGILSHPKGKLKEEVSVADWLYPRTVDLDLERSGIVHRLDRATSGVMILAKNPVSKSWLMKQFSQRNVHKKYLAIIEGVPNENLTLSPPLSLKGRGSFRVDMPIGRNPKRPTTFFVTPNGKEAQTDVEVLDTNGSESLVLLSPKTGRTHQIRVHMWANGWPIVGDAFYNDRYGAKKEASRLMLHALSLTIQTTGDKEWREFKASPPKDFIIKLKELGLELKIDLEKGKSSK